MSRFPHLSFLLAVHSSSLSSSLTLFILELRPAFSLILSPNFKPNTRYTMKFPSTLLVSALLALPGTHAWGSMGHEAIAYIAQNFLTTATATYCQSVLGDSTTSYLANVATWADSYRYTTAGAFSAPYHYIDAEDNPPDACSVSYTRDCGSAGCVVSAIKNYVCNHSLTSLYTNQGLFYRLHFLIYNSLDHHSPS